MNKHNYRYFEHANNIAKLSDFDKVHIGCVAIYNNKILSVGYNTNKTHPIQQHYNTFRVLNDTNSHKYIAHKLHAEVSCLYPIRELEINWNKVELYIYRIRKSQPYGMSRPCKGCMQFIYDLGIENIYYTSDFGYVHEKLESEKVS